MNFAESCNECVRLARETAKVFYVMHGFNSWNITSEYSPEWLFKAYPGGRKIMSQSGIEILNEEKNE